MILVLRPTMVNNVGVPRMDGDDPVSEINSI